MLFNSHAFLLVFLPVTWLLHRGLIRTQLADGRAAHALLVMASLAFYGWWSVRGLLLLLGLMAANYAATIWLVRRRCAPGIARRMVLLAGLTGNLAILCYFKYANFLLENWAGLIGTQSAFVNVALPLGISFFTFQKIALLVDAYLGKVVSLNPLDFMLFVTFFPQLIAGPIVHHAEVMPQFARRIIPTAADFHAGLTLLAIGLAKKILIADTAATWASPVFARAGVIVPGAADAWGAAVAYSLQLYFDFSGYCDMALGAALLLGIHLPVNFDSPYKAASIIDFWRRWHMTLSRFLRDYLYIPLGGNRAGAIRHQFNLFVTMLLGGIWHGAGWTFVVWGALHGVFIVVNHGWRAFQRRRGWRADRFGLANLLARSATLLAVLAGWVFFRSADMPTAFAMLKGMAGQGNASSDTMNLAALSMLAGMLGIVWLAPNSMEIAGQRGTNILAHWEPGWSRTRAVASGLLLAAGVLSLSRVSEFLYFQF